MNIELPQEASIIQGENKTELPFPVAYWWVKNGNSALKAAGGVQYYGGWATNMDDYNLLKDRSVVAGMNAESYSGTGGEFAVYASRWLAFAPIATRFRWMDENGNTMIGYDPNVKARSHVQVLCLARLGNDESVQDIGVSVLSAKGIQSKNLQDAMKKFADTTKELRGTIDARYFWNVVGTFGDFNQVKVGKGQTSTITPISTQAKEYTAEVLEKRYVGKDNVLRMVDYYEQAAEWRNAWDKQTAEDVEFFDKPLEDIPM